MYILFQIIIMLYLKNDYKLKNVMLCKSFCLNFNKTVSKASNISLLNKTVSKTSNISLLNKMVFLLQASITVGYSRQFDKYFVTYNVRILDSSLEKVS